MEDKGGNILSKKYNIKTELVHGHRGYDEKTGAVSYPIYQSATFRHPALFESTGYDYSRTQNPTREELEDTIASLENGCGALAFSSGMAAISNIFSYFKPGDHLIVSDDLYGGTYRLLEKVYKKYDITATYIDFTDLRNLEDAINENTRAIFIESPSNPMMKVTDIRRAAAIGKKRGLLTIVDNTFLSPYFQKPLELGADLVVHSGTKFLGGHDDTLAGFIVAKDIPLLEELRFLQNSIGAVLAPFDSWLILRGLKTLAVRMERQQENAIKIASWLKTHSLVESVYYVGLPEHPDYEVSRSQSTGFGSMISFSIKNPEKIKKILSSLKVITFAESLGGVKTLMTYPYYQTHADISEETRNRLGVNENLLRISVGIEDLEDLIKDLDQALA